jgi:hypothetical protein
VQLKTRLVQITDYPTRKHMYVLMSGWGLGISKAKQRAIFPFYPSTSISMMFNITIYF